VCLLLQASRLVWDGFGWWFFLSHPYPALEWDDFLVFWVDFSMFWVFCGFFIPLVMGCTSGVFWDKIWLFCVCWCWLVLFSVFGSC
jgi:hypothetical protein